MSVNIAVVEIDKMKKNDWIEKIEIENEVMENKIKNEIKV